MGDVLVEEIGEDGEVITPLSELEPAVRKRVLYLKQLQDDYDTKEKEYLREIRKLDQKYAPIYGEIFAKRSQIVTGGIEAPDGEYVEVDAKAVTDGDSPKGVPSFWLNVLKNSSPFAELIEEADEDALEYLTDIRAEEFYGDDGTDEEDHEGFTLTFEFAENPYFTNKTLTKTYKLDNEDALEDTQGCKIDWKPSKNLTMKVLRKKSNAKGPGRKGGKGPETKVEELESFFKFFTPLAIPQADGPAMQMIGHAIQADFDLGVELKDDIIPNAVTYFLGENEDDDEDEEIKYDEEDDDDDDDDDDDEDDDEDDEDDEESEDDEANIAEQIHRRRKVVPKDKSGSKEQPAECKQQ